MAARAHIPFYTAFQAAVRPTGLLTAMESDATLKGDLLALFNRSYKIGYQLAWTLNSKWEDARTWAEITPTAGVISYTTLDDSRDFEIWTLDPRESRLAQSVTFFSDGTNIKVSDELTTVWVGYMPRRFHFNTTAWATSTAYVVGDVRTVSSLECYRCIVAHTSGTFATDLAASKWVLMPVLEIFEEYLIRHVHGTNLRERAGEIQNGTQMQQEALADLLELHRAELRRNRELIHP